MEVPAVNFFSLWNCRWRYNSAVWQHSTWCLYVKNINVFTRR